MYTQPFLLLSPPPSRSCDLRSRTLTVTTIWGRPSWGRGESTVLGSTDRHRDLARRAFDVTVSLALALLTLPVLVLAALGSLVSLRAWPFFVQERVGRRGETFRFLKVRTLPPSVPAYVDKHQLDHHSIPPFCLLLRRLHLDELPQLYLVMVGRMSLVGPRPEMQYLHDAMPQDFASARTAVRPGCTGLWQISKACTELISSTPEYDRFYLENRSLRLDLWVLGRTALKMTRLSEPVSLEDVPRWATPRSPRPSTVLDLDAATAMVLDATTDPALSPRRADFGELTSAN